MVSTPKNQGTGNADQTQVVKLKGMFEEEPIVANDKLINE